MDKIYIFLYYFLGMFIGVILLTLIEWYIVVPATMILTLFAWLVCNYYYIISPNYYRVFFIALGAFIYSLTYTLLC